ncbi:MAG TPA: hypothetical protein VF952_09645 [Chloroflexia bacterium]|jgi:hypothetical protein
MKSKKLYWLSIFILVATLLSLAPAGSSQVSAQGDSRTFPETGKTVKGAFLQYWNTHGGLPQQGFPISEEMQEVSETDGKTYTVQYFERAVFELHTELQPPNNVLLSLLGVSFYKQKYGDQGASGQVPNTSAGSQLFPQTGKRVGGAFLQYWQSHGGLAQQGYPISEQFVEVSPVDGKSYTVQYFERAVFELHPELQAPNNVLLSLLGRFQYDRKYGPKGTPGTGPGNPSPTVPPSAPTAPPADPNATCDGIPAARNATVRPNCGPRGTTFEFSGTGFQPGENVGIYVTAPDQSVIGADFQVIANDAGNVGGVFLSSNSAFPLGVYAVTYEGTSSRRTAIGYFKIIGQAPPPTATPLPPGAPTPVPAACDTSGNRNAEANPSSGRVGDILRITARGFRPGENVSYWLTTPDGLVGGTETPDEGFAASPAGNVVLSIRLDELLVDIGGYGNWALSFQGEDSQNLAIARFCINP